MRCLIPVSAALASLIAAPALAAQVPNPLSAVSDTTQTLGQFSVPTNADLRAVTPANAALLKIVTRQDYAAGAGAPPLKYSWKSTCPGSPDNVVYRIAPTLTSTGCWQATFPDTGINILEAGAVGNNSTDNTTALQTIENIAASISAPVYCPAGEYVISGSGITMGLGVVHRGAGYTHCIVNYTGTAWAYSLLLPNGTAAQLGPSFYGMSIYCENALSTGGCIKLNDPTHGFTQDGSSQENMYGSIFRNIQLVGSTVSIGLQITRTFYTVFDEGQVLFHGIGIDSEGSDILTVGPNNKLDFADTTELLCVGHFPFGNEDLITHNAFEQAGEGTGATNQISTSCDSDYIEFNQIEQPTGNITNGILIASGVTHYLGGNSLNLGSTVTSWLNVQSLVLSLTMIGNTNVAGASFPSATFIPYPYFYNASNRATIIDNNASGFYLSANVPFNTAPQNAFSPKDPPLPVSGALDWQFTPDYAGLLSSNFGSSVTVINHAFALPAASGTGSLISFQGNTTLPSAVDVWVCGLAVTGGQTITVAINGSPATQALTTTPTCYLVLSNVSPSLGHVNVSNADTSTGSVAFINSVVVRQH